MGGRGSAYYEKRNQEVEQKLLKLKINSKKYKYWIDDPESERTNYNLFEKLKNQHFSIRESTDKYTLEELEPYLITLNALNKEYELKSLKNENEIQFSSYKLNGAYGAIEGYENVDGKIQLRLTLDTNTIKNKDKYVERKFSAIHINKQSVYVENENIHLYTLVHEYGHLVEENIIRSRFEKYKTSKLINYNEFKNIEATRIKNEVIREFKNKYTNNQNNDMIYLSKYSKSIELGGTGNDLEWFAETFTNLQLSNNPAPIALELEEYIRRNNNV